MISPGARLVAVIAVVLLYCLALTPVVSPALDAQPVDGPSFLVNTMPVGCHVAPSAEAPILVMHAPGAVRAVDLVDGQQTGGWYREQERQCWIWGNPFIIVIVATLEEAEAYAVRWRAAPRPFLTEHRIVSFYGNPLAAVLGVLGEQGPEQTVARLRAQAEPYARLSDDRRVVPALHLIYAVAQDSPGADGTYLLRISDALVRQYIDLTRDNGMLLFLDIQMGTSTIEAELRRIMPYLAYEHIHLALDPEFAWGAGVRPVSAIGHLTAGQINQAQVMLRDFAVERGLASKILIVHQFRSDMIRDKAAIAAHDRVELVIDMDGFGSPPAKLASWNAVIRDDGVQLAGIKLFYQYDTDLMTPAQVLNLTPRPAVIIYQ